METMVLLFHLKKCNYRFFFLICFRILMLVRSINSESVMTHYYNILSKKVMCFTEIIYTVITLKIITKNSYTGQEILF